MAESRQVITSRVLTYIRSIVREVENQQRADNSDLRDRAEIFYGHVLRLTHARVLSQAVSRTVRDILLLCLVLVRGGDRDDAGMTTGAFPPPVASSDGRQRGRPRFLIQEDTLIYLLENGFSDKKIAEMMCVSRSTIRRRMRECGLYVSCTYSILNVHA